MKPLPPPPLRLLRRDSVVTLAQVPPERTLLQLLREDLGLRSVKEGCAEGDCGACTVVLAEAEGTGLRWRAVNSCIRLAHSVDGMAVWTAEDLDQDPAIDLGGKTLHPAQQALVEHHGSQCGFCTPGFVMSLFGLYQNQVARGQEVGHGRAQADLSGNLCRCTGYRPILDAAAAMGRLPPARVDEDRLRQGLESLAASAPSGTDCSYLAPQAMERALQSRASHPGALVVAGGTDVGLWITKGGQRPEQVLDLTRVAEWRAIERYPHHLAIGAAVTLQDAFSALLEDRPQLATFFQRFAALPVRHSGTLAGNIANGSPIGDSMPLLIALGASVLLMRRVGRGRAGRLEHRELALEDFYLGYRQTRIQPDELLAWVKVPRPAPAYPPGPGTRRSGQWLRAYKVSKRFDDDISAVCLAVQLGIERGQVVSASIGAGGVGPVPSRARQTEVALVGQPWNADTVQAAVAVLRHEFRPISDLRASAAYRTEVLGQLLWRAWLESQQDGDRTPVTLDGLRPTLPRHGEVA